VSEIVVDTSALISLWLRQADFDIYESVLIDNEPIVSAATRVELGCVAMAQRGTRGMRELAELMEHLSVAVVPVDRQQTEVALTALERYGRGRGKAPAVLNFGDLFSYALAKSRDLPLLFKGKDFAKTDIRPALPVGGGGG